MDDVENKTYYSELQAALRSYDQKLWMIPGFFGVAVGLILNNIDLESIKLLKDGLILFIGSLFLLMLILLYNKAHIFHVSIQKKVNEFDNNFNNNIRDNNRIERIPLTSMTEDELDRRINRLEAKYLEDKKSNEGAIFNCIQKFLAKRYVSSWVRNIMLLTFIISFLAAIFLFSYYFCNSNI